ncbi:LTA synthase family protein [Clostridium felsineum]|uniref:LTA synthase family protein n=1 Tax=Clostridium felsineum TaxID=36839 RepID=UPI00098CD387|nr:LTA synthase family protein [Clostridium felsineum]URZ16714.1 Lipoteichoic acid synthase 2 [Clostridium felsineum DSM 794]
MKNLLKNLKNLLITNTYLLRKLKNLLLDNLDILLFLIIIPIKLIKFDRLIYPEYTHYKLIIKPIMSSTVCLLSIAVIFKSKIRTRLLYIFDILISILIIADTVYFSYFKDIISIGVLKNGVMLGGVKSSVTSLITLSDFLYFVDVLVLIPILFIYKKHKRNELKLAFRASLFLILLIPAGYINGKAIYNMSVSQPNLLQTMYNKVYIDKFLGTLDFHVLDLYNVTQNKISNSKKLSSKTENNIKNALNKNSSNAPSVMTGRYKGKNLIIIQVEALQQFVINSKVENQEITPNLNRWINKSLYFNNYFYQVSSGNTSDAEFLSNNSFYPASSGAAYYLYAGNTYSSLAKEMNDNNYYTAVLHGYKEGFWNRNVMYKAQKFKDFFGEKSFNLNETVGLGLSDKSFLRQSLTKLKSFSEPYYSFVITLSSHYPYDDTTGYGDFNVGSYDGTLLGDYLKGIHYTDAQLGEFLDNLEKSGIMDNSVVVLYGDHYAIPKDKINDLYDFQNIKNPTDLDWYQLQKVPMFIHFPKDENKGVNNEYSGQIDLYPTIANMFGLPQNYMLGTDLFSTKNRMVIFRNGSFTDGNVFYVSWTNTYYDIKTGTTIAESPKLKKEKDDALVQLQYSDNTLNHNLLKKFTSKKKK